MIAVLTAAAGAAWEARLIAELATGAEPGIRVVRRCVDVVDLLAVAGAGQATAVLVDAGLRRFDAAAVDRLAAAGIAVVGIVSDGHGEDAERLAAVGVGHLAPQDATVAVIAEVLRMAADDRGRPSVSRAFADPTSTTGDLTAHGQPARADGGGAADTPGPDTPGPDADGSVVAVWGPAGAPGRTTVAIALADELARLGQRALLVDADVYGGVIASALGLLDESAGFAAACRQAQSRRLDAASLAALCWQLAPRLRVLTGISRADRWPELRATAVAAVLGSARRLADFTIVDLGFCLETDEELSFDTMAPRRNGATLAILDEAELVIAVGSADAVGIQRLVRGLAELREAGVAGPVRIVLNRVRRGSAPGDVAVELDAALARFAGQPSAAQLPFDIEALDAALATGRTLSEAAPGSALRRALIGLAASVAGVAVPDRRRRRRR